MSSDDEWPRSKADYSLGKEIGSGATSTVFEAVCTARREKCAIKCINLEKAHTNMSELANEISAMSQCQHPNVVNYYTSFVVGEELWVVMRLLDSGSLLDVLRRKMRALGKQRSLHGVLDEASIATVLREILRGLEYFHSTGYIHRDIKAGNILFAADGTVQIADFGVASCLAVSGGDRSRQQYRHTFVGTPCWMAPEVMEQEHGYDYKADIWSLGILAIELATGHAPYYKYPALKIVMMTLRDKPPSLDTNAAESDQYKTYGKSFRTFIKDCLQKDPKERPTASQLLKYGFLKKAKDRKFLVHNLIDSLPSVHVAPESGKLRRNSLGQWEFDNSPQEEPTAPGIYSD